MMVIEAKGEHRWRMFHVIGIQHPKLEIPQVTLVGFIFLELPRRFFQQLQQTGSCDQLVWIVLDCPFYEGLVSS